MNRKREGGPVFQIHVEASGSGNGDGGNQLGRRRKVACLGRECEYSLAEGSFQDGMACSGGGGRWEWREGGGRETGEGADR